MAASFLVSPANAVRSVLRVRRLPVGWHGRHRIRVPRDRRGVTGGRHADVRNPDAYSVLRVELAPLRVGR